jgi:hypothetical protein
MGEPSTQSPTRRRGDGPEEELTHKEAVTRELELQRCVLLLPTGSHLYLGKQQQPEQDMTSGLLPWGFRLETGLKQNNLLQFQNDGLEAQVDSLSLSAGIKTVVCRSLARMHNTILSPSNCSCVTGTESAIVQKSSVTIVKQHVRLQRTECAGGFVAVRSLP